jgi:hypothetical protein
LRVAESVGQKSGVKEELMSSGVARWALVHLDSWTWLVAEYRVWVITIATVAGLAAPLLGAARRHLPRPGPSLVIRSGALALSFSAATVTVCSLLHFSDLRWLAPSQRTAAHVSAPGGILSFAKPIVNAVNSVTGIPAEFRATQVSVHIAVGCALLALAGFFLVAVTWRRARRADIRQIVREEMRSSASAPARKS